jgi:Biopolymer transport protein
LVFLLLIFFLLTSNFLHNEGIKVNLPAAKSSQMRDREEITVSITKDNRIFLDVEPVNLDQLSQRLTETVMRYPDKTVIIKADKEIILERAVRVLDAVKLAGAKKLWSPPRWSLKKVKMSKSTKIAFIISLLLHISIFCLTGSGSTPPPTKKIEISLVMNQSKSEEQVVSKEPVKEIKRRPVKKVVVKKKVGVVREKVRKKMLRAAIKPEPDRSPKNGHQASKKVCMTSQDPQPPLIHTSGKNGHGGTGGFAVYW